MYGPDSPAFRESLAAELKAMACLRQVAARCMNPATTFDDSCGAILDAAIEISGVARGNLQLVDRDEAVLRIVVQRGFLEPFLTFFAGVDAEDRASCGAAMNTRGSIVVEDITRSAIFAGHPSLQVLLDAGVRSVVSTPLIATSGRLVGVMSTHGNEPLSLAPATAVSLELLARQSADYIERAQDEDRLRRDHQALEQSETDTQEFLAILAHELRGPLAPIRAGIAFLQSILPAFPDLSRAVRMVDRQVVHMGRMIDDLSDFSDTQRSSLSVRIGLVQPFDVVQDAVDLCQATIDSRRQSLQIDMIRRDEPIAADRDRLSQALGNLLANASQYTPEMGRIEIAARREGDRFVFRVKDEGVGLPVDQLEAIFLPFVQLAPEGDPRGLGIGLTLTRRIVELHSGTVEARSSGIGHGSTFVVELPLVAAGALAAAPPARRMLRNFCRILVVDDHPDTAESLALLLRAHGHDVRVASDGSEALRTATSFHPRVVLLDLGMPGMDGNEIARRMRELPWARASLFLAISGWSSPPAVVETPFHARRTKPVDPDELLRWIDVRLEPDAIA